MQTTKPKGPQLVRPGPIGLGIRVLLGAAILYWFAALLTKWGGFLERDPIESGRLYTLFTIWLLPEVFALTFRRPWGLWPAVGFLAGGAAIGLAGYLAGGGVWNPVLAGWTYAGRHRHPKPRVRARRAPLAPGRPRRRVRAQAGLCRGLGPPRRLGGLTEKRARREPRSSFDLIRPKAGKGTFHVALVDAGDRSRLQRATQRPSGSTPCRPRSGQGRVVAYSSMSRRVPPISWWLRSRPSRR
jgi:hypothetical protein